MSRESDSDGGRPLTGQAATSAATRAATRPATVPCEILRLDQIDGAETRWLWPDRFPVGHVTVLAGEAGSGKSLLAAEIAARVSRGEAWPEAPDPRPAGSVVIAHSARHLNAVVKRRLLAAGAGPQRPAIVNRDGEPPEGMTCGAGVPPAAEKPGSAAPRSRGPDQGRAARWPRDPRGAILERLAIIAETWLVTLACFGRALRTRVGPVCRAGH